MASCCHPYSSRKPSATFAALPIAGLASASQKEPLQEHLLLLLLVLARLAKPDLGLLVELQELRSPAEAGQAACCLQENCLHSDTTTALKPIAAELAD